MSAADRERRRRERTLDVAWSSLDAACCLDSCLGCVLPLTAAATLAALAATRRRRSLYRGGVRGL